MRTRKLEEKLKVKAGVKGLGVPLKSRRWMPLLERMVLELEFSNPSAGGGRAGVFLNKRGGREVLQERYQWERETEIFIIFAQGQNGIRRAVCLEDKDLFER